MSKEQRVKSESEDAGNTFALIREVLGNSRSFASNKGGSQMNQLAKKLVGAVLGVGMLVLGSLVERAYAYTDAIMTNNTAQITITIRPNVDRSVTITTDNVHMDMGNVDLTGGFVSTQTVKPSTVTIGGTFGNTDLLLSANITPNWTFDASSDSLNEDKLATWVTFTSISSNTAPSQNTEYFFGVDGSEGNSSLLATDLASYGPTRVGFGQAGAGGLFENALTSMNKLAVNDRRHMWMFFRMPNTTTTTDEQKVTFILTVDGSIY